LHELTSVSSQLFQCWYLLHGWLLHLAFAGVTRFTLDKALQDDGVHAYPELQDDSFSSLQYMCVFFLDGIFARMVRMR